MTARRRRAAAIVATAIVAAGAVLFASAARAGERPLGSFGVWEAYAFDEGGQTACFMVDHKVAGPVPPSRKPPYLMITHRPTEASTDVFSYGAGVPLDSRRDGTLTLGPAKFGLFAARSTAWAREALTDHRIAKSLTGAPAPSPVLLQVRTGKGTMLGDRFDVTGAAAAYHAIGKACGLVTDAPPKPKLKAKVPAKVKPKGKAAAVTAKHPPSLLPRRPHSAHAKKPALPGY